MNDRHAPLFTYAIALGSNRALAKGLGPAMLIDAGAALLDHPPLKLLAQSRVIRTAPIGPSRRHYANAVAVLETELPPPSLLLRLQAIEARYGRQRRRRWGERTLDIDIILWSGGIWSSPRLAIPHVAFRDRKFVLQPLAKLAPDWRDPVSGLSVRQLCARRSRRKPVDHHANPL